MALVATMAQPQVEESKGLLNAVPAWGSYLYQNFLVPTFSPTASMSEWLNLNTPFAALTPRTANAQQQTQALQSDQVQASPLDYFGSSWKPTEHSSVQQPQHRSSEPSLTSTPYNSYTTSFPPSRTNSVPIGSQSQNMAGPSNYYSSQYFSNSIPTSLLMGNQQFSHLNPDLASSGAGFALKGTSAGAEAAAMYQQSMGGLGASRNMTPSKSLDVIDKQMVFSHSPSPMTSAHQTPHLSPKRGAKRRCDSLDSEDHSEHEHENEHEVPEGVERDGMIWGMKVDDYRALSARERKRVRNRISARTFRAKRKEHLSSLEENMGAKDLQLRLATEEASRLRAEVAELKRRLSRYEDVKPNL